MSTQHFIRHFPQFWIIPLFLLLLLNNYACIDSEYTVMQYNVIYNAPRSGFFILVLFVQQTFILRHVLEEEYISTKPFHVMDKWYKFLGGKEKSHAMQYIFFPFLQTPIFSVQSFFIVTNPRRASIQRILETNQLTNDSQNPLYIYIKTI